MIIPFRPVPILFGEKYEGDKLRRFSEQFTTLAQRVAALGAQNVTGVPSGGTVGQVLTRIGSSFGWASPTAPGSVPWSSLTGIPTSFSPSQHLIANTTGLGPAHSVLTPGPGSVLLATGTAAAQFGFLNYSQLGDVDASALASGTVPQWNGSKWVMVPLAGGGYSGLTPGNVLTALSPTSAAFQPIVPGMITGRLLPAQIGADTAQYGLGAPLAPLRPQQGTQYAQLNEPGADDSLLAGSGRWVAIRDIGISWSQLSDVPQQMPPLLGKATKFLRDDGTWASAGSSSPLTTKGDLYTFSSASDRLPVGVDGTVLSSDSTQATGLKWIAASGTGTVTQISAGSGIALTPSPITTTGSVAIDYTISPTWTGTHIFNNAGNCILLENDLAQFKFTNSALTVVGSFGTDKAVTGAGADVTDFALRAAAGGFNLYTGANNLRLAVASAGNVTISAPTSGTALQVNNANAIPGIEINAASGFADGRSVMRFTALKATTQQYDVGIDVTGGTGKAWGIRDITANAVRLSLATTGILSLNTPTSGVDTLVVSSLDTARSLQVGIATLTKNPRLFVTHTEATGLTDLNFTGSTAPQGSISVGGNTVVSLANNRNVTITAPASGVTLSSAGLGGLASPALAGTGTDYQYRITDSSGAADAKHWAWRATGSQFVLSTVNDAFSANANAILVTRSGFAISGLTFGNSGNNPTYTFAGTGLLTINGGTALGAPTGGNEGAGTINAASGYYLNGVKLPGAVTQATVTLPTPAHTSHAVVVTDASVSAASKIMLTLGGAAPGAVNEWDDIDLVDMTAVPGAGQFTLQASFLNPISGPLLINYMVG